MEIARRQRAVSATCREGRGICGRRAVLGTKGSTGRQSQEVILLTTSRSHSRNFCFQHAWLHLWSNEILSRRASYAFVEKL